MRSRRRCAKERGRCAVETYAASAGLACVSTSGCPGGGVPSFWNGHWASAKGAAAIARRSTRSALRHIFTVVSYRRTLPRRCVRTNSAPLQSVQLKCARFALIDRAACVSSFSRVRQLSAGSGAIEPMVLPGRGLQPAQREVSCQHTALYSHQRGRWRSYSSRDSRYRMLIQPPDSHAMTSAAATAPDSL